MLPGGDVGGDRQASESLSVRFHRRDHPGVLVTYTYHAAVDPDIPAAITVDRETEYLVCTDPADPGGTEVWSAYRHSTLPGDYPSVQAAADAALQAAQDHLAYEEPWVGRPPWNLEQQEDRGDVDRHLDGARVRAGAGGAVVPGRANPGFRR